MTLTVRGLRGQPDLDALREEWAGINAEARPRNPFTTSEWIKIWWKHFCRRGPLVNDRFFVHVIRNPEGDLVGVAPLILTERPGIGPFRLRILNFFGADTSLTEFRGVICKPQDQTRVIRALVDFLVEQRRSWDVIEWSGISPDDATGAAILELGPIHARAQTPMYLVRLPAGWSELTTRLSSNMRKNLRKAYQSLQECGLQFRFRVVENASDIVTALDRFLVLHKMRADATEMIVHPNKFQVAKNRDFLLECVGEMAEQNLIRIFELWIGDQIVASRISFVLYDSLYFYYAGYDPNWRRHSVMTILMSEALKWAIAQKLLVANLSAGTDLSKLRWKPEEVIFESFVQVSPALGRTWLRRVYLNLYTNRHSLIRGWGLVSARLLGLRSSPRTKSPAAVEESLNRGS